MVSQCRNMIEHVGGLLMPLRGVGFFVFALLLPLLFFSSCSSDDEDTVPVMKPVLIRFTLSVGQTTSGNGAKAMTRADEVDWTQYTTGDAEGIENRIDVDKLHVLLYTVQDDATNSEKKVLGQLAGEVQDLHLETTNTTNVYRVLGSMLVPQSLLNSNESFEGRVMVFANTDALQDGWALGNLDGLTYSYDKDKSVGQPSTLTLNSIPMWGVSVEQSFNLQQGSYNDLGTIDLLRSMAKVTVSLRQDMIDAGFTLKSLTLSPYNTSGAVMPLTANVNFLGSSEATRNLTYVESFHLPDGVQAETTPLSFLASEGDTQSQTLYIPEYDNTSEGATPATIAVTALYHGKELTGTLEFKNYSNGTATGSPYNIVRNHWYQYTVYNSGLGVDLHVTEWAPFDHEPFSW